VRSREGLRKAKPIKPKKREKRTDKETEKENERGEKKRNHTHILTKVDCALLTINSSLLPEHQARLYKHYAHDSI